MNRMRIAGWCGAALLILGSPGASLADDWDTAEQYFVIADAWSNYATQGPQYGADFVIDNLLEARQQRVFITIIENRILKARADTEADLAREQQWDYDRDSGGTDVVVGPDMAQLRILQRRKIRDLERTLAAYDAVLGCLDAGDDRCVEVREIERRRAEWRATGDPLPPDPDVPGAADLRELLESALARHRLTLDRHREDLERLQRVTNRLAGAHIIFEDRLDELRNARRSVDAATSELEARRDRCRTLCEEARTSADAVRRHAAAADSAAGQVEQRIASARALASSCTGAADADRIDALLRDAETTHDVMTTATGDAGAANGEVRGALDALARKGDVGAIRTRLRTLWETTQTAGGAVIDQLVTVKGAFDDLGGPRSRVAGIADDLASLDVFDDEVRSWEKALSDDPATQRVMRQRFADLRREYQLVRSQAQRAVDWADELTATVGGPDLLEADFEKAGDELRAAEERARNVSMPDCDVQEIDLAALTVDRDRTRQLLNAVPDLRRAAADCRSQGAAGPPPGPSRPSAPPAGSASGTGSPPPPATAPATAPSSDVFGGLVIAGLPPPARITVGQVLQLEGRDHGGRPYTGVEWVSSNEQVLLVDRTTGRIIGEKAGTAMVLAKRDGMRAWLDVEVVDPAAPASPPPPTNPVTPGAAPPSGGGSTAPQPTAGGSPGSPASGSAGSGADAADDFDFGDGGSGTVEVAPSEDGLLGVSPTIDPEPTAPPPPGPLSMGLLGVDSAADGGDSPPPEPFETFDGGPLPEPAGTIFDAPPERQPLAPPAGISVPADAPSSTVPSAPTQADIVQMLQQLDCSWLPGGVPAYDQGTGQIGCTCPPGTELATDRPACLDCASPQSAFMSAVQAQSFQLAQQAINAAGGCSWAPYAQAQLGDFVCTQAEIAVLEALESGGPAAAQNAVRAANAQGCTVSEQTIGLVASAAQPPPSYGASPPPSRGPGAAEMVQMLTGVTQSLIAMQGGDPGSAPSFGTPGPPPTTPSPGGGAAAGGQANPGESREQCAHRLCERECANAIGLLTEGTTPACDACLKRRRPGCGSNNASGAGPSGSGAGGDGAFSSGSGAWANPQWTMPTGEGGGRCFAGGTPTRPHRYAIACDGNDGSAIFKLAAGGYISLKFGPASFTDCQRYLAQLTGGQ